IAELFKDIDCKPLAADIPELDASKIGTGTFDAARSPTITNDKIAAGIDWNKVTVNRPTVFPTNTENVSGLQGLLDAKVNNKNPSINGDLAIHGGSINQIRPDISGGWARGLTWRDTDAVTLIGGIGINGSGDVLTHL